MLFKTKKLICRYKKDFSRESDTKNRKHPLQNNKQTLCQFEELYNYRIFNRLQELEKQKTHHFLPKNWMHSNF